MVGRAEGGGHLCGYVGVQSAHPYYGREFHEVDLQAHGGVNLARHDKDNVTYWFGFDCGHAWDFGPSLRAALSIVAPDLLETMQLGLVKKTQNYRDVDYVKSEIASLAKQLKALEAQ